MSPDLHYIRRGQGRPLLLVHGIGGSWRSWDPIIDALAVERDVIAIDLPGHGQSLQLSGENSTATVADALTVFITSQNLLGVDAVGSSIGARLVLELARRGNVLGAVVSLDPSGFWPNWPVPLFYQSVWLLAKLVRAVLLTLGAAARGVTAVVLSPAPCRSLACNDRGTAPQWLVRFGELFDQLLYDQAQQPAPLGSIAGPLVIGWGRQDWVCLPSQARRALEKFPDARLYWFENCGHSPQWDQPAEVTRLILAATSRQPFTDESIAQGVSGGVPALGFSCRS